MRVSATVAVAALVIAAVGAVELSDLVQRAGIEIAPGRVKYLADLRSDDPPSRYCGIPLGKGKDEFAIPDLRSETTDGIEGLELGQVHVFLRHGDRTTYSEELCWPTDPVVWSCDLTDYSIPGVERVSSPSINLPRIYRRQYLENQNARPGNCMTGQLSRRGFDQEIANGEHLRKAYVDSGFLSSKFSNQEIFLRSDDSPRTIQSLQGVVMGMYPVPVEPTDHTEVIDIFTMDYDKDDMIGNPWICPKLKEMRADQVKDPEYLKYFQEEVEPLRQEFAKIAGMQPDAVNPDILYDCLTVHLCMNYELPVNTTFYQEVVRVAAKSFWWEMNYPDWKTYSRYALGPLLRSMHSSLLKRFPSRSENELIKSEDEVTVPSNPKLYTYLGHDVGPIMPMANAFGFFDNNWAPYASMIVLEFYEDSAKDRYVRAIFNGKVVQMRDCGEGELCKWEDFFPQLEAILPTKEECPNLRTY